MIENLKAYPVFDSLGGNAIKVRVSTDRGSYSASVPVKGDLPRLLKTFSSIRPNFTGLDESDRQGLDSFIQQLIPGVKPLSLAMSLALARAGSDNDLWRLGTGRDFPLPLANAISNRDMQEFFIIPHRARNPMEAAGTCLEAYNAVLEELKKEKLLEGRTPQGSWFCGLDLLKVLEFLSSVADDWELKIGCDFHASELWNGETYVLGSKTLGTPGYLDFMEEISHTYGIYYLEDPFRRGDFQSLSGLSGRLKKKLVACKGPHVQGQEGGLEPGNGILIIPSRFGTLSDMLELSSLAAKGGIRPIISQGLAETDDSFLADISILCNAPLLKMGLSGSERLGKFNRLIELWHEIPGAGMAELP